MRRPSRSRSRPISCGIYGYPLELAAAVAVGTVTAFLETDGELRQVLLVGFGTVVTAALRGR